VVELAIVVSEELEELVILVEEELELIVSELLELVVSELLELVVSELLELEVVLVSTDDDELDELSVVVFESWRYLI
jgi:hypothetical protein